MGSGFDQVEQGEAVFKEVEALPDPEVAEVAGAATVCCLTTNLNCEERVFAKCESRIIEVLI